MRWLVSFFGRNQPVLQFTGVLRKTTMTDAREKTRTAEEHDDLTRIKGIGEVTQQWLRDTFAVQTFHDLAQISPADIEERLKLEGKITTRSKIEEWLAQAQDLAGPISESADIEQETAWKTVSTFVVMFEERRAPDETRFQIKAHHMEADHTQVWPGHAHTELVRWMVDQLGPAKIAELQKHLMPPVSEPAAFSDKLQNYAAKAHLLAGEQLSPPLPIGSQVPTQPEPSETAESSPSPHSGKLQQFIRKARQLAGDG
jgi:hypothetical protein